MASKPKELSNLQRDLLQLALQGPKAKIWLPKASQQSFPTTYAAIARLSPVGMSLTVVAVTVSALGVEIGTNRLVLTGIISDRTTLTGNINDRTSLTGSLL